ncbi:MAG: hypothetical protein HQ498_02335 [Pseudohongiella sp.]|nr:hypothetical protein [Pseudohongiella sp.]
MRNPRICGAGGVINIQQNYRIVIPYRDSFCKLLRFSVARDGSVNFSPYLKGATEMLDQSIKADTKGSLSVKYGTGELTSIENMSDKNILKINYHASGFVHYGDKRTKAKPIREIEAECEIAMLTFLHPKEMGLVNKTDIGPGDMVAQVNIRDSHPLFASITLAKWTEAQTFTPKGQCLWMQMLKYDIPDLAEMVLGVYLFETNSGPWPTECGTLIKALPGT